MNGEEFENAGDRLVEEGEENGLSLRIMQQVLNRKADELKERDEKEWGIS